MFRKSRKKIVVSIMAVLTLFLAVTLVTIYCTSYLSLKKQNEEMLERYVSVYSLDSLPGEDPPSEEGPDGAQGLPPDYEEGKPENDVTLFRLSSFYSVALSSDGEVLAVDSGNMGIYREAEIIAMAEEVIASGNVTGTKGSLLYRVDQRESYTVAAFMDMTLTDNSMNSILRSTLIAGAAAMAVFFAASVVLSDRIIRPLEENDRKQKQFVSDAGHELKTPVSVVNANAELLYREIGDNQWLSNIRYENERMGDLVRELLELSHAENSPAVSEIIDFSRLSEQEILPFESVAFENGLTMDADISKDITVKGNRNQLAQLVSILVDNAISHSEGGTEIGISLKQDHRRAVFTVTNPSAEISAETISHLFDRFYRTDEARGDAGGHFGLGLPISKAITEAHHGKITMAWHDGIMTSTVSLPAEI